MAYESLLALNLVPYVAGEQPKGRRMIKLNTNENPYPPSPEVAEVLRGSAECLRLYPDPESTELRTAIAEVNGVEPEQVFCGNGSDEVLALSFAAFFSGKTLWAPDITYSFYPVYSQLFDVSYQTVPLREDFTVDVDGLMKGGPIVLANPNAPTGIPLPLSELSKLAESAKQADEILLVDEAYAAFSPWNALPLLSKYDNLLIVRTFSKSHSLAGLRVGFAIGSPRLIDALRRVRDSFNSYPVDRLAQSAAAAAMRDTSYTAGITARVCETRDEARRTLTEAGSRVLPSGTNFLFVQADRSNAAPIQKALREEGILVRHFSGDRLGPWLRVTIGTPEDTRLVTQALIRLIPADARITQTS